MFGLKQDWSLDVLPRYFTLEDYEGGEARWCPGCGDHGVLSAVQRICRDEQLAHQRREVATRRLREARVALDSQGVLVVYDAGGGWIAGIDWSPRGDQLGWVL